MDDVPDQFPQQTGLRLREWIGGMISEDPVPALQVAALDRGMRDLSVLHLSCYTYSLSPNWTVGLPLAEHVVQTDRGYALAVCRAQRCIAEIACALHGEAGIRLWLAAMGRERTVRRQIAERIVALVDGAH